MRKKYIVITGWVISGIGKGVTTASTGFFFSEHFRTSAIKLDGYLNIDPGTMNPVEHGEVFVLADGAEVDMDFGHYERFLWSECSGSQSISMGKIFAWILEKERRGDFLGKTVQMIPHVTDYICERIENTFEQLWSQICLIELWGTIGDIEVELYSEAIRQLQRKKKKEDFLHIHLTYVPIPWGTHEQKTKPTQQSINLLHSKGLFPDIIVARGRKKLTKASQEKIALFSNLRTDRIFSLPDVESIYKIPSLLAEQKYDLLVYGKLGIDYKKTLKKSKWDQLLDEKKSNEKKYTIGIIGKYTALEDSYSSVIEALRHSALNLNMNIEIRFIDTRKKLNIEALLQCDGCIVPGGFWDTGIENMIEALSHIRYHNIPCLWICLGLQLMTLEFARNVLEIPHANSIEFDKWCAPSDIITLLDSQKNIVNLGGTMRLWKQASFLEKWQIYDLYKESGRMGARAIVSERFRHRFEVNPEFVEKLEQAWFLVSGKSVKEGIVQYMELKNCLHPYYVGTQSHPELTSRLEDPAPLFMGLLRSVLKK